MPKLANHETIPIKDGKTVYLVDKNDKERIKKINDSIEAKKREVAERLARVSNMEIKERNRKREAGKRKYDMPARPDLVEALPLGARAEIADLLHTSRSVVSRVIAGEVNWSPLTMDVLRACEIAAAINEWNKKSKACHLLNPVTLEYKKRLKP